MRPPSHIPEIVADKACRLAGPPLWHPASGLLYWSDAHDGRLCSYDPAAAKAFVSAGGKALLCAPRTDGGALLLGMDGGLKALRDPGAAEPIPGPQPWGPALQLDAAALDDRGWLYCAVRPAAAGSRGKLYRLRADGVTEEVPVQVKRISGLGFAPGGSLYCCDAVSREIVRLTPSAAGGFGDPHSIVSIPASLGAPYGMAIDAKGFLWVAVWGGSCILRISPAGREELRVYFTAKLVSGLTFGGSDLRDLYVVTSGAENRKANGPGAGALYRLRPGVKGVPARLVS
jgi:sugar lactone lactonase YvrE